MPALVRVPVPHGSTSTVGKIDPPLVTSVRIARDGTTAGRGAEPWAVWRRAPAAWGAWAERGNQDRGTGGAG